MIIIWLKLLYPTTLSIHSSIGCTGKHYFDEEHPENYLRSRLGFPLFVADQRPSSHREQSENMTESRVSSIRGQGESLVDAPYESCPFNGEEEWDCAWNDPLPLLPFHSLPFGSSQFPLPMERKRRKLQRKGKEGPLFLYDNWNRDGETRGELRDKRTSFESEYFPKTILGNMSKVFNES